MELYDVGTDVLVVVNCVMAVVDFVTLDTEVQDQVALAEVLDDRGRALPTVVQAFVVRVALVYHRLAHHGGEVPHLTVADQAVQLLGDPVPVGQHVTQDARVGAVVDELCYFGDDGLQLGLAAADQWRDGLLQRDGGPSDQVTSGHHHVREVRWDEQVARLGVPVYVLYDLVEHIACHVDVLQVLGGAAHAVLDHLIVSLVVWGHEVRVVQCWDQVVDVLVVGVLA